MTTQTSDGTSGSGSAPQTSSTHLVVTFDCNGTAGIADTARSVADQLKASPAESPAHVAALRFLDYLASGQGIVGGSKGSRFSWTTVAAGLDPHQFVRLLRPFWTEILGHFNLLDHAWEGPAFYDSVIILHQQEGTSSAGVIDVWNRGDWRTRTMDLVVTEHPVIPFTLLMS